MYPKKLAELLDDFSGIQSRTERADVLIYYSKNFREVPLHIAKKPYPEDHRVIDCESQAYVWSNLNENGTMQYYFAVENPQGVSAKAMASILDETLSGETPNEIEKLDTEVVYKLFGKSLSMGKSAGLTGIINTVLYHAKQFSNSI